MTERNSITPSTLKKEKLQRMPVAWLVSSSKHKGASVMRDSSRAKKRHHQTTGYLPNKIRKKHPQTHSFVERVTLGYRA